MFYKALDGVKVVEFGNLVTGPFCAKILADFGAEVIKIEEPAAAMSPGKKNLFIRISPASRTAVCSNM